MKYLVCFDYGTGGVWRSIIAKSESEIRIKFPELTISKDIPSWMSEAEYSSIMNDPLNPENPDEFLKAIIAERKKDNKRGR